MAREKKKYTKGDIPVRTQKEEVADLQGFIDSSSLEKSYYPNFFIGRAKTFRERISGAEARKKEAEADDAEGDIRLKKRIARVIIFVLILQTIMVFVLSIAQSVNMFPWYPYAIPFNLEDWNFRILVSATLIQTYYLMRIVVAYLFPNR